MSNKRASKRGPVAKRDKRTAAKRSVPGKSASPKRARTKRGSARPRRDAKGPLGWLVPDLESAYSPLVARGSDDGSPRRVRAARSGRSVPDSATAVSQQLNRSSWRDLLMEFKQRKAAAVRAHMRAPAPIVPGGRNWLPLGPTVVLNGQTVGNQPVGGRVSGIAVAPGGQMIYAASANGGVFRSDDGGTSWRALMDGFDIDPDNFASTCVICGAIAIDLADPNRVYVGTGEGDTDLIFRENLRIVNALPAYRGVGPVRTDDGGTKWSLEESDPDLAGESFFALAVDPGNRENVVGATTNGLYRRVPGAGGTYRWERQRPGIHSSVAVASAGNVTRFVAAEWGKSIVHSTDGGQNWSEAAGGLPSRGLGRITLAMQRTNSNLVYALISAVAGGLLGLFRLDATGTWKRVTGVPNVLLGKQGDYDLAMAVVPGNPDIIYIGGDSTSSYPFSGNIERCLIQKSGASYKVKTAIPIGTHAHADIHTLVHTPGDPTELWCGCDGGVFLNRNPTGTGQFASQNSGLACLCTNFFAQHPTDPGVLLAGLQDNGTARTTGAPAWTHVQDGDGGYCVVNWADPTRALVYMNGGIFRSTDGGATFADNPVLSPRGTTMTLPVVTPPYNPANPAEADIVAVGSAQHVFLSTNFGSTWPAKQRISLPANTGDIFALAFASPGRLFIGTTQGAVFRADASGNTWATSQLDNSNAGPLALKGLITDIAIDWGDATRGSIYVSFGGQGDDRRRVWRFDGTKWEPRSGPDSGDNLLNMEHNAIVVDSKASDNVYVAADIGVWHSSDRGLTWAPLENGLPDSPVYDILIHPTQRLLRAATHGRGIYELALT
jgi:photosystem II stability/assembly factor-like uncharacterized protein